jgi:hypothetical protein
VKRRPVHNLDPASGTDGQVPIISGGKFVIGSPLYDAEAVRDTIGAALTAGTGTTVTVNDAGDTITIAIDTTAEAERIRDVIGAALTAGTGVTLTVNDAGDTITLAIDTTTEAERVRDVIGSALVAGTGVTITVNDAGDTITIDASASGLDAEGVRDTIGAALVAGSNVTITVNDAGDTITIASTGGLDAEGVRDTIGSALVAGTGATITVNDAGDTITIAVDTTTEAERIRDTIGTALVAGSNVTITVNDAGDTITIAASAGSVGVTYPFTRTYASNQADGVIGWLGTAGALRPWISPAAAAASDVPDVLGPSALIVSQINDQDGNRTAIKAVDHSLNDTTGCSHTQDTANAWWKMDFGSGHTITPTKFALVGRSSGGYHPRNWKVQGSNDNSSWTDLVAVTSAGPSDGTWYAVTISGSAAYRYIRVYETGANSNGTNHLVIGDLEVWGTVA